MRRIRPRLTYANVISSLCLLLLVGGGTAIAAGKLAPNSVGTAQLKKNAVTGAKVKNGSLTGSDLKLSTLGTVPAAQTAQTAQTAKSALTASTADRAGTATSADRAATATSAATAGRATLAGTAEALTALEPSHVVGTPGEPAFLNNSKNGFVLGVTTTPVSFYKDHDGIVHLEGLAEVGAGEVPTTGAIFILPPGFRPAAGTAAPFVSGGSEVFVFGSNTTFGGKNVEGVVQASPGAVGLGGIAFRAGS